jgi:hypothetical protein
MSVTPPDFTPFRDTAFYHPDSLICLQFTTEGNPRSRRLDRDLGAVYRDGQFASVPSRFLCGGGDGFRNERSPAVLPSH